MRGSILLRGTCLRPPKTTGVCVMGEGSEKTSQLQELNQGGCDRLMERGGHAPLISNSEHFYCLEIWPSSTLEELCDFRQVVSPQSSQMREGVGSLQSHSGVP